MIRPTKGKHQQEKEKIKEGEAEKNPPSHYPVPTTRGAGRVWGGWWGRGTHSRTCWFNKKYHFSLLNVGEMKNGKYKIHET